MAKPEDTTDQVLAQVKGGKYQLGQLRDFLGVMEREQAAMGLYTTVEPIRAAGARTEATHRGLPHVGRVAISTSPAVVDSRLLRQPDAGPSAVGRSVYGEATTNISTNVDDLKRGTIR